MRKCVSKSELFRYINLILLVLAVNLGCSGLAAAYDLEENQGAGEINTCESEADGNMDAGFNSDTEFTVNTEMTNNTGITDSTEMTDDTEMSDSAAMTNHTATDCFHVVNGEAAGAFRSRLSDEDYDCLLRIVEAEAGVCDEKGKILVANVVLNRMETEEFPDTVREVVYQERQFSPVSSGRIDRVTITDETVEAVRKALEGTDYSEGALFFVARKHAEKENLNWFDNSLEFLFEHDGHEFFKCKSQ